MDGIDKKNQKKKTKKLKMNILEKNGDGTNGRFIPTIGTKIGSKRLMML